MTLGSWLGRGGLAVGLAAALAFGCDGGGDTDGGVGPDGGPLADGATPPDGSVGLDGATPPDGSVLVDGGPPGPFVPVALLVGGNRGEQKLFAIDLELTQTVEISHDVAYVRTDVDGEYLLDVAPDGRRVAYGSDDGAFGGSTAGVYVAPTDRSGGAVQIEEGVPSRVAWAPDGSRLLYLQYDDESGWGPLVSVLPDGTGAVTIGESVELFEWSPDSQRVLYVTSDSTGAGAPSGAFVVGADGSGEVDLVAALEPEGVTGLRRGLVGENPAAWSPDGARIALCAEMPVAGTTSTTHSTIYLVDPDGTNPLRLAPAEAPSGLYTARDVRWAPDGSRLAFRFVPRTTGPRVHTILPNGTGEVSADGPGAFAGWSPDSRHVALMALGILSVAPADTMVTTQLTELTSRYVSPEDFEWSPDSASIAYLSDEDGAMELFVAAADGTNPTKVSMPLTGVQPVQDDFFWSEDSGRLFYRADDNVIEVARPSPVAPEPLSASNHAEVMAQARAFLEDAVPEECEIRSVVRRLPQFMSELVEDCHVSYVVCELSSEETELVVWVVCREAGTSRWTGVINTIDLRELNGVVAVSWM